MSTCGKGYGSLPSMCRRIGGHDGDCGPGDHVEQAMARALEATRHLREMERSGEAIPGELWNFLMTGATVSDCQDCTPADGFLCRYHAGYAAGLEAGRLRAALEDKYENTKAIANMVKDSEAACHRIVRAIRRRAGLEP